MKQVTPASTDSNNFYRKILHNSTKSMVLYKSRIFIFTCGKFEFSVPITLQIFGHSLCDFFKTMRSKLFRFRCTISLRATSLL